MIWPYGKLEGCSYQGGTLKVNGTAYPTTLFNTSETFGKRYLGEGVLNKTPLNYVVPNASQFDTVIVMNVLVYSNNAFEFLETLHRVLTPGGLLLFHDRYFLNMVQSSKCKTAGFQSHMIQVVKPFLEHFFSFFETEPYFHHKAKRPSEGKKRPMVRQHRRGNGLLCGCAQKGYVMLVVVPTMWRAMNICDVLLECINTIAKIQFFYKKNTTDTNFTFLTEVIFVPLLEHQAFKGIQKSRHTSQNAQDR